VSDGAACSAVGEIPVDAFDTLARQDASIAALAAVLPTLERLTRCVDVRELLEAQRDTHCPHTQLAADLSFAVRRLR
jgi:hypothetical protein